MILRASIVVAMLATAVPAATTEIRTAAVATTTAIRLHGDMRVIGRSVEGRDIVAYRSGESGGRVVLVVGATHGNEPKGVDVAQRIRALGAPAGVELWVVDTINPDGLVANRRTNANGVDINRNFSWNWNFIPRSSVTNQYSGLAAADQPETQAIELLITQIRPVVTVWYHQASNRVSAGGARRELSRTYAALVGQIVADTPCSAGCTGTGSQFTNHTVADGTAFLVELANSAAVTDAVVTSHATALLTIATM